MTVAEKQQIVTIDGPSGVGKSTISWLVAKAIGFSILDTGAMYRAIGFYLQENRISYNDEEAIARSLEDIKLEIIPALDAESYTKVKLNNRDITMEIRSPEISAVASKFSSSKIVRVFLTDQQRNIGKKGQIVTEGRDMGSVVFPNAEWKFYLDAELEIRARRRCQQLAQKGENIDIKAMMLSLLERDQNDTNRDIAPLQKAEDAMLIDTTNLTKEEVVTKILTEIRK